MPNALYITWLTSPAMTLQMKAIWVPGSNPAFKLEWNVHAFSGCSFWDSLGQASEEVQGWEISSERSHPSCCVLPQDLSLRRGWREPAHHALSLHGHPALCPPVLPPPVDQKLRHALLWALQVWLHNGDQAQAPPEGTVPAGTGVRDRPCKAACFKK